MKDYKKKEKKKKLASVCLEQVEIFSLFVILIIFGIIYGSHFTFLVSATFIYITTLICRHTIFIFKRNLKSY